MTLHKFQKLLENCYRFRTINFKIISGVLKIHLSLRRFLWQITAVRIVNAGNRRDKEIVLLIAEKAGSISRDRGER